MKNASLALWRHRRKICLQNTFARLFVTTVICHTRSFATTNVSTLGMGDLFYLIPFFLSIFASFVIALQSSQVHATRSAEAAREHAYAVGTDSRRPCALPHHRSHHIYQRNSLGDRACVLGTVGVRGGRAGEKCRTGGCMYR